MKRVNKHILELFR